MSSKTNSLGKKQPKPQRVRGTNGLVRLKVSPPVTVPRESPAEFSCGVDFDRALRVEESLDKRERRG